MALDIVADQRALHNTSKTITSAIKSSSKYSASTLWQAPKYTTISPNQSPPAIPSADIFESLFQQQHNYANSDVGSIEQSIRLPKTAECAVHLEFLATLWTLRQRVLRSEELDEVFDIKPEYKYVDRKGVRTKLKDDTLWTRRQVKWEKFVSIAVVRFLAWWGKVPKIVEVRKGVPSNEITNETLPPLDILMVWHSFLLNPRYFRESCRNGKKLLYHLDFPWAGIHEAINSNDWTFSLNERASDSFQRTTGLQTDLFQHLLEWKGFSLAIRKRNLELSRFTLQPDIATVIGTDITPHDLLLIQCFIDANATMAQALKEAVNRQESFIDKMNGRMWIRSPALDGTLLRARQRFSNFLRLFKLYPSQMLVPTLDIDLVWHTHQCSPGAYFTTTQEVAGKFVNHDDSIVKDKLDTGFEETKDLYRIHFGQEYQVCGCWDCEALLSAMETAGEEAEDEAALERIVKQVNQDVAYYRTVEAARRKGEQIPMR